MTQALRAREGLVHGGDLQNACWTYYPVVYELLDCAPSLDSYVAEVESALEFAEAHRKQPRRGDVRGLPPPGGCTPRRAGRGAGRGGGVAGRHRRSNPLAAAVTHVTRALGAAVLDHPAELARHTAAAMPLLRFIGPSYPTAVAHVLRALSLADNARAAARGERLALLSELDDAISWLAARAADAPVNFLHLLHLVEAERAWATGDFRAAAGAFDAAQRDVATRQRPWHHALILERAARFYLAHGIDTIGCQLLAQARQAYLTWGATAKVDQIDWAYPTIHTGAATPAESDASTPADVRTGRSSIMTGTIDLLGIHAASQALSSETTIDGLRTRVAEVLSAMTGATGVHLLLWDDEQHGWLLPTADGDGATPRRRHHRESPPGPAVRRSAMSSAPAKRSSSAMPLTTIALPGTRS